MRSLAARLPNHFAAAMVGLLVVVFAAACGYNPHLKHAVPADDSGISDGAGGGDSAESTRADARLSPDSASDASYSVSEARRARAAPAMPRR